MSNQDYFTQQDCVIAWREAQAEADVMFPPPIPAARPVVVKKAEPATSRPLCLEHRERVSVMSWGMLAACSHTFCQWGTDPNTGRWRRKTHSDGEPSGGVYSEPEESSDEIISERQELTVGAVEQAPIAGDDSDFVEETETESETEIPEECKEEDEYENSYDD